MNGRRAAQGPDGRDGETDTVSRRAMLAATAGLSVSTSGCMREVRNIVVPNTVPQLSLTITTLPADGDRESTLLARELGSAFETVGIDVSFDIRSGIDFARTVLYDHDFDVCVGRHPGGTDPDFLYEALHSEYADESGWQNPFGFTNLDIDALLEEQRRAEDDERREAVTAALEAIVTNQPFAPICVPEEHRVVSVDRFGGWGERHPATGRGYLGLEPAAAVERLRITHTDPRPTENLNPLAADYRDRGVFTDLLYDSLGTDDGDGTVEPWLARSWEWTDGTVDVRLRTDCQFHDGEPLTADDVAFTYRFLRDMALGDHESEVPTPRYRGETAAVESVVVRDADRLEMRVDTSQTVGERAFLVPILPEHVWEERAVSAPGPGGGDLAQGSMEAVVTNNIPPVGSGPFQFVDRTEGESLTLERFDGHFTRRPDVALPEPTVDGIDVGIAPNVSTAIQVVEEDAADVTSASIEANAVGGVDESGGARVLKSPSWTFYCLGFNARKAPFSNPRLRRVLARLIDKEWLIDEVFDGHARPIATPVGREWVPTSLEWNGMDPETPFLGSNGEVNVDAARSAFESAGFRYDDRGRLRVRQ